MVIQREDGWHVVSEKGKNLGGPYKTRPEAVHRLQQVEYFKRKGKTAENMETIGLLYDAVQTPSTPNDQPEGGLIAVGDGKSVVTESTGGKTSKAVKPKFPLKTFMKTAVLGIPDRSVITNPRELSKSELWQFNIQRHDANRAGTHYDLRLVDPSNGIAHSWAARNLPTNPGDKTLAVQQPDHTQNYASWEGTIEEGYGAGKVMLFSADRVEVTKSTPDHILFNVYKSTGDTERYALIHTGGTDWLFHNVTPTRKTRPEMSIEKPKYKSVEIDQIDITNDQLHLAPKYDGALNAFVLRKNKPVEVYSYRKSLKGDNKLIDHTFRLDLFKNSPVSIPGKTVLLGEVFARDVTSGRVMSSRATSARLLSNVWRSRELQKDAPLDNVIFDVVKYKGRDVSTLPYKEKFEILREVVSQVPGLKLPPVATTTNEKALLIKEVKAGIHPLSQEGVIVYDMKESIPQKAKLYKDFDVTITGIYPGEGKYEGSHAGGFTYKGGRVGTGFDDTVRKDMYENPQKYIGTTARVTAQEMLPSGALRAPSYKDIRAEEWPRGKKMKFVKEANLKVFHAAPDPKLKKLKQSPVVTEQITNEYNGPDRGTPLGGEGLDNLSKTAKQISFKGPRFMKETSDLPDPNIGIAAARAVNQKEGKVSLTIATKLAGLNWGKIGKDYLLPSLAIGPVMGAAITAATSRDSDEFKKHVGKGITTGIVADAAMGLGMGLWNQKNELTKMFKTVR
jgi:hypothetical protein